MNDQLSEKFKHGDIVLGKVIEIEPSKALIEIEGCKPVYIIKEVTSIQEIESVDDEIKAVVIWMDIAKRRISVSTKELEVEPGDMLKDPKLVYGNAEKMAEQYRRKRENLL